MSELKAITAYEANWKAESYGDNGVLVYLKSAADKVIAELKAQKAQTDDDCAYWKTMAQKNADDNAVMAKQRAEADAVIAELEESHKKEVSQLLIEIEELKKQVHDYAQGLYVMQARAEKELRHHKYKRCLDNAWWCRKLSNVHALFAYTHRGWKIARYYDEKAELYRKWHKRWLELAEKFKEGVQCRG